MANSRVGVIISAYIPYGSWESRWRRGNAKDAVLPEPVAERTSRCEDDDDDGLLVLPSLVMPLPILLEEVLLKSCSIRGIIARWTGVGLRKPNFRHVETSGGHNPRLAKVVVVLLLMLMPAVAAEGAW